MVQVERLMYCFQESEPDSRPPPVAFSPPKAPPISAPEVGMFTFTIPQSEPLGPIHCKETKKKPSAPWDLRSLSKQIFYKSDFYNKAYEFAQENGHEYLHTLQLDFYWDILIR